MNWFFRVVIGLAVLMVLLPVGLVTVAYGIASLRLDMVPPGDAAVFARESSPEHETFELRLATFNIQFTWIVGQYRAARARAIAAELKQLDPDVVAFQEAFVDSDVQLLMDYLSKTTRLIFHQRFPSSRVGSGLLVSSAFPVHRIAFEPYGVYAPVWRFWEADGMARKGVAMVRLKLPSGSLVDIFNTHAQAAYPWDHYEMIRERQLTQARRFVEQRISPSIPAFFLGDINCGEQSKPYASLTADGFMERAMAIPSGIDHIFHILQPGGSRIEVLYTQPIEKTWQENGVSLQLSDHHGFFTIVRVHPAGAAASDAAR